MFPDIRPVDGKRLVPGLAVGCVVFAILGLAGTFGVAKLMKPYFHDTAAHLAQRAQERERSKGN